MFMVSSFRALVSIFLIGFVAGFAFGVKAAHSADLQYRDGVLFLTGKIEPSDPLMLEYKASLEHWNPKSIVLDSGGGSVDAAFQLAGIIARNKWSVTAMNCSSACALLFAAGRNRTVLGAIGVHQAKNSLSFGGDSNIEVTGKMGSYLLAHGAPLSVVQGMLLTPPDFIRHVTPEELAKWR